MEKFSNQFYASASSQQDNGNHVSSSSCLLLAAALLGSGGARGHTALAIGRALCLPSASSGGATGALTTSSNGDLVAKLTEEARDLASRVWLSWSSAETYEYDFTVADQPGASGKPKKQARQVITLANAVFLQEKYGFVDTFTATMQTNFHAHIGKVDFTNQQAAVECINKWVNRATNQLIPRIFASPSDLEASTRCALLTSIYFRDHWNEEFLPGMTEQADFSVNATKTIRVPMMSGTMSMYYADLVNEGLQVVSIPLRCKRFSFVIILPAMRFELPSIKSLLTTSDLHTIVAKLTEASVQIQLPRFELEFRVDLASVFGELQLASLFSRDADLSGITQQEAIFVDKALQTAVLRVTEKGVEASAIAAVSCVPLCARLSRHTFHVNQPFVCALYDHELCVPLFMAAVTEPKAIR